MVIAAAGIDQSIVVSYDVQCKTDTTIVNYHCGLIAYTRGYRVGTRKIPYVIQGQYVVSKCDPIGEIPGIVDDIGSVDPQ